jgi:hypothetical protein
MSWRNPGHIVDGARPRGPDAVSVAPRLGKATVAQLNTPLSQRVLPLQFCSGALALGPALLLPAADCREHS